MFNQTKKSTLILLFCASTLLAFVFDSKAQKTVAANFKQGNIKNSVGKCITTPDLASDPNGDKNGANIFLSDCYNASNTGYNQKWTLKQEGDFVRLIQTESGRCVTTPDLGSDPNGNKNGANIFLYDCYNASNTGYNQKWKVTEDGDSMRLVQMESGKCITTPDLASDPSGDKNGANIFLYDCYNASNTGYNQKWKVTELLAKAPGNNNISPLSLPVTANNGSSTWKIDSRGGVTGSITYTVGSGSGSKKYASAVVVEFLDGSTYYAEATKTIGRPFSGTRNGTHVAEVQSILLNQMNNIRRVFVHHDVSVSLGTIRDWKNYVLDILDEADADYQRLKNNGLVQDAATASGGS